MSKGLLLAATLLSFAAAAPAPAADLSCAAPLKPAVQIDLYFGRQAGSVGEVGDAEWARFLAQEVTPRFPDGLTVVDAFGQYREGTGAVQHERTKLLVIVAPDARDLGSRVRDIVSAYTRQFGQRSVFHVEHPVCAGI